MGVLSRLWMAASVMAVGMAALLTAVSLSSAAEPAPQHAGAPPAIPSPPIGTGPSRDIAGGGFTASPLDVNGEIKEVAARFVERVGTWRSAEPQDPAARVVAAGYPAELVTMAGPLVDSSSTTATTTIVYPQYGGLTDTSASVIVLARQVVGANGGGDVREVLLDVRVRLAMDGTWQVTSIIDPPRPAIAPRRSAGPTKLGRAVLDNPRIRIPEPGRADIADRRVGDPILAVLDKMARIHTLDVQVLASGHPGTVFPTTWVSNHPVGRAFDVRTIDGRPVIDIPRDDPLLAEFAIAASRAGATEVVGPIPVDGRGFLTDAVHQDHFHLGITPTKPPASPAPDAAAPR